jgi:CBS domain containing-hemolysin-like protein
MDTPSNIGPRLLLLALITAINAFFAAAEIALLSAKRPKLQQLANDGNLGAQAALKLLANTEKLLSVIQVGISITSLAMGVAGEEAINHWLQGILLPLVPPAYAPAIRILSLALTFICLTTILVVIGEVVPKNFGIVASERLATLSAPVLLVVNRMFSPLVYLVERLANLVSRLIGLPSANAHGAHSVEEIRHIVESSQEHRIIGRFEASAMDRLLELRDLVAREVMTPRSAMVSLPITATLDELLKTMSDHHYSRVPIFKDSADNIIGIVHFRDLLIVWQERRLATERRRPVRPFRLDALIRKLPVIPETKNLSELIDEFRANHAHMALVVNEFGAVSGVLTLEDVFEQVFGEIEDEHDLVVAELVKEAPQFELDGLISSRDLETRYGIELHADAGFETLAGYLLFRLGFIPKAGQVVEDEEFRFTVLEMEKNRIGRVLLERKQLANKG